VSERRTSWIEVQIEVAPGGAEIVASVAADLASGIELRDDGTVIRAARNRALIIAHVAPENRDELIESVNQAAALAREAGVAIDPVAIREREAHEDEWRDVWKQYFRATRIGRSFLVRPSWDPGSVAGGDRVIDLDPGRAFGTGGHASTRLVIALVEELADARAAGGRALERFLDLGCGSGILSIAAARLWPDARGLAVDLDPEATACARENLDRNRVTSVYTATGSIDMVPEQPGFDVVLANIQADVLVDLAPAIARRLAAGGEAILSGLLLPDAEPVLAAFRVAGLDLVHRHDEGEWAALHLRRRQPDEA
jgi:ribosomal protein L11 methyltransferase